LPKLTFQFLALDLELDLDLDLDLDFSGLLTLIFLTSYLYNRIQSVGEKRG